MNYYRAVIARKKKSFEQLMESRITVATQEYIQDPMYPNDPEKLIPSGNSVETEFDCRLIRSSKIAEDYKEGSTGFMPDAFKFILTLEPIQETATFDLHGVKFIVGKLEKLIFKDNVYGYRSPVSVYNQGY